MNTSGLRHYPSTQNLKKMAQEKSAQQGALESKKISDLNLQNPVKGEEIAAPNTLGAEASNVNISKEAKELSLTKTPSVLPSAPSAPADLVKQVAKENVKEGVKEKAIEKLKQQKEDIKKRESPAIIFIKGHFFEGSDIEELASNIPRASLYSYNDHKEILGEINKKGASQKIILVGHGLGGDTALEVAQELNQARYAFKKVDLLVTLDAVGVGNDFVPHNVTKNVNFIGNQKSLFGLLNDGPKIAQNSKLTSVENELRPEGHTEIDESDDIQFRIFHLIKDLTSKNSNNNLDINTEIPSISSTIVDGDKDKEITKVQV